ncbi:MAG TPA: NAD-dependent epimerase/dehydratase family protein [Candidatus Obscuribacterales bacterium]
MKKALITGGTGFVGANLARRLLSEGHEVHLLVRPQYLGWRLESIRKEVRIHEYQPGDQESIETALSRIKADWIFHLAAHGAYSWQTNADAMVKTNVLLAVHLTEAAIKAGFEAFINTGSSSEYGFKDHAPAENEVLEPNSYYAVTKASATMLCRFLAQKHKLHMPTLRLYSVYGPYEEPNRLMPKIVTHGLAGRFPPLVNPSIARDYVYVDDVLDAYLLAAQKTADELGAVYNVGTGRQTTLKEVVEAAKEIMAIQEEPQFGSMPDRDWDTTVWVANNRKISEVLGWRARYSLKDGLAALVEWFRANADVREVYAAAHP